MFFLYSLAFLSLKRSCDYRAGCLLGMGLFKPQLVLPFMVELAAHRRWMSVFGFLTAAAFVGLASLQVAGKEGFADWISLLRYQNATLTHHGNYPETAILPAAMPNLRGAFDALLAARIPKGHVQLAVVLCSGDSPRLGCEDLEPEI